jgi:hypothetical protein
MRRLEFLPNSPTLMNAGTRLGLLSGCVVLPLEDSLASIFEALGQAAQLHQAGGGTGYSFSGLRPRGDLVASTGGTASGPVSLLTVFNTAAGVLAQGGRRRGAPMAVLDVSHPDIREFIDAKRPGPGVLQPVGRGDHPVHAGRHPRRPTPAGQSPHRPGHGHGGRGRAVRPDLRRGVGRRGPGPAVHRPHQLA